MTDEDELACILWDYGINSHNHIKVCTHDCCRVGVLPHVHASAVARCAECRAVFERQEWKLVMVTAKAQANACSVSVSLGVNVWCSAMRTEMTHTHTHKSVLCNVEAWQPSSFSFPCLSVSFFLPSFLSFVVWGGGRKEGCTPIPRLCCASGAVHSASSCDHSDHGRQRVLCSPFSFCFGGGFGGSLHLQPTNWQGCEK